jgi:hypothetical protein
MAMSPEDVEGRSWKPVAIALVVIIVLAGGVLTLLGSQVSGVLSTVGASVGNPGDYAGGGGGSSGGDQAGRAAARTAARAAATAAPASSSTPLAPSC